MDKLRFRIQLLSLLSIYFIYRAIAGLISKDLNEFTLWLLITFAYIISLIILYFVIKRWQKEEIT